MKHRALLAPGLLALLSASHSAAAQYAVRVELVGLPAAPVPTAVYLAGTSNGWDPAHPGSQFQPRDGRWTLTLPHVAAGPLEFRLTRGSWHSVETTARGRQQPNRVVQIRRNTTLQLRVAGWRDAFPASSASPQVQLLDSAFWLPQLQRHRRVWVYLPADYATTRRRYPVLYMHDGQSLFDDARASGREGPVEWEVDETLDAARRSCLVVAIASDPAHRTTEYNPRAPSPEAQQYLADVVETLKPFVDRHYRTRPDAAHTYMAGSSLGGLLTFYAGLYYPEVFGRLGVLSPSFWAVPDALGDVEQLATPTRQRQQRYYFYAGEQEIRTAPTGTPIHMAADARAVAAALQTRARPATSRVVINPTGRHGAQAWRQAFPAFYAWLTR